QLRLVGPRAALGELHGGIDLGGDPPAGVVETRRLEDQRVARLPAVDLFRRAVAGGDVFAGTDVLAVPAGHDFQQLRAARALRAMERAPERVIDRDRIVALGHG